MTDSGQPRPLTQPPVPARPPAQPHSTDDPAQGAGEPVGPPELVDLTPDAPMVENAAGGKQSRLSYRFDLLDAPTMLHLAAIFHEGAEKYGANNWRKISVEDHLNHLACHVYAYLSGNREDDHLGHALARALMAAATENT